MLNIYVGVYWGGRIESDLDIAEKAKKVMDGLTQLSASVEGWTILEPPKNGVAPEAITTDLESLEKIFSRERDEGVVSKQTISDREHQGVRLHFSSIPEKHNSIELSFDMGNEAISAGPNSCVVKAVGSGQIFEPSTLKDLYNVLRLLVEVMQPDWGKVGANFGRLIPSLRRKNIYFGWITYSKRAANIFMHFDRSQNNNITVIDENYLVLGDGLTFIPVETLNPKFLEELNLALDPRNLDNAIDSVRRYQ